jgi:predicted nucleic acid-binding protein
MTLYVVDVSVAAKWFLPEIHSDAALRLCHADSRLHVPGLFDLEFSNIVCKRIRRQEISTEDGYEILQAIAKIPMTRHPDNSLLSSAFELANQTYRSLYDCLYLALAVNLKAHMVTADHKFYENVSQGPLKIYLSWVEDLPTV